MSGSISIFNASRNKIVLATHSPVTTQSGDADFVAQRTRYLANTVVTLVPGVNTVDLQFWQNWQNSQPANSLNRILYPA
jgi:hypothetical protein